MGKKIILFGGQIEPACQYCELGRADRERKVIFCRKKGVVTPHGSCRSFLYAPLKRIPKRAAALPCYSKEDFTL